MTNHIKFSCKVAFLWSALFGQTTSAPEQKKNSKCNCCVTCPVKLGLLQQLFVLRLQWVQNTAARIVTQTKRSDHITPILQELHCSYTCCNVYWQQSPVSCIQLHEWHSPPVPSGTNTPLPSSASSVVFQPILSSHPQCRQKTLWSQSIFQCCTKTVEQSPNYSETA